MELLPEPLVCLTLSHSIDDLGVVNAYLADDKLAPMAVRCIPIIIHEIFGVWPRAGETINYLKVIWGDKNGVLGLASTMGMTSAIPYLVGVRHESYLHDELNSALSMAAVGGHVDIMNELFRIGALLTHDLLKNVIKNKQVDTLRTLLNNTTHRKTIQYWLTHESKSSITAAAVSSDDVAILKLLVDNGLDVTDDFEDIQWNVGFKSGTAMIQYLHELGVDIPLTSLFITAVADGNTDDVDKLIVELGESGFNFDNADNEYCSDVVNTALERCNVENVYHIMSRGICDAVNQLMKLAAAIGDTHYLTKHIIRDTEIDMDNPSFLRNIAMIFGQLDVLKMLRPYLSGNFKSTFIDAAQSNYPEIASYMFTEYKFQLGSEIINDLANDGRAEMLPTLLSLYIQRETHDTKMFTAVLDRSLNRVLRRVVYAYVKDVSRKDLTVTMAVLILHGADPTPLYTALDELGDIEHLIMMSHDHTQLEKYVNDEVALMSSKRKLVKRAKLPPIVPVV